MSSITLTIRSSAKQVEIVNILLAKAIEEVKKRPEIRAFYKINMVDVRNAERFRDRLLESFLNTDPTKSSNH